MTQFDQDVIKADSASAAVAGAGYVVGSDFYSSTVDQCLRDQPRSRSAVYSLVVQPCTSTATIAHLSDWGWATSRAYSHTVNDIVFNDGTLWY